MKKIAIYCILIFFISAVIGFSIAKIFYNQPKKLQENSTIGMEETSEEISKVQDNTLLTDSDEEKVSPNAHFALKKYYNQCGHFKLEAATLPQDIVNLTRSELEKYYEDWDVEEFSSKNIVLVKEINSLCDEHFIIKLGKEYIEIHHVEPNGETTLYKTTEVSKEYLAEEDIEKLKKGIYVFGKGKLNSVIEDYE